MYEVQSDGPRAHKTRMLHCNLLLSFFCLNPKGRTFSPTRRILITDIHSTCLGHQEGMVIMSVPTSQLACQDINTHEEETRGPGLYPRSTPLISSKESLNSDDSRPQTQKDTPATSLMKSLDWIVSQPHYF